MGLSGDDKQVFGAEEDGRVIAWQVADGKTAWQSNALRYRVLSGPLLLGRSVALGDDTGVIHLFSRADGSVMGRALTDGTPLASAPVLVGNTMVVVTRKGGVFAFQPE